MVCEIKIYQVLVVAIKGCIQINIHFLTMPKNH